MNKKQFYRLFFIFPLLWALLVCSLCHGISSKDTDGSDTVAFKYATLLKIVNYPDYRVAIVRDPWNQGRVLHTYVLVPASEKNLPASLPEGTVVRTPIRRTVVFTSVHCGLLDELGRIGSVAATADVQYILNPRILIAIRSGKIADVGQAMLPNVEKIIRMNPDGLLVSPFQSSGGYGKLEQTGIPLIECADYMETSPLGRAEWMRFFGILYGCEATADSLFAAVESRYKRLSESVQRLRIKRPRVMIDHQDGSAWYVPAANSTLGQMIQDAGGAYLFSDQKGGGSVRLSFETVFKRARNADIWLLKYGRADDYTYKTLKSEKEAYAAFRPWKTREIYGCNTLKVPFFDKEPFHPELLLSDFVQIFYPDGVKNLIFYSPLSNE